MKEKNILLVEDEMIVAMMIKLKLNEMGYKRTEHAVSGEEAVKMAAKQSPDLVIMDIFLKGKLDGIDTAKILTDKHSLPIIFLTGDSSKEVKERAALTDPVGYLEKPFMDEELEYVIRSAMHKHDAQMRTKALEIVL